MDQNFHIRVPGPMRQAVEHLARVEGRPVSNAFRLLVREALIARGALSAAD
jgi:hypothetical protein